MRASVATLIGLSALLAAPPAHAQGSAHPDCRWSRDMRADPSRECPGDPAPSLELPVLPVERNCGRFAAKLGAGHDDGTRNRQMHHCMREEQFGYDYLKLIWGELSDRSKRECLKYVNKDAYQYANMQGCASGWLTLDRADRERQTKPPAFRY